MAKKTARAKAARKSSAATTKPKFPYSNTPGALRKFLKGVPDRPKPAKVNNSLLKSWDIGANQANTIIRVLKALNFVDASNYPTEQYASFMQPTIGPAVLGNEIRKVYTKLFEASHEPFKDSDEDLRRLFNIHSGGGESTLRYQVQTFKALCEFATFEGLPTTPPPPQQPVSSAGLQPLASGTTVVSTPPIHIDLHIHLPESKTARDYQAIIEDIAKYIYRHEDLGNE